MRKQELRVLNRILSRLPKKLTLNCQGNRALIFGVEMYNAGISDCRRIIKEEMKNEHN